MKNELKTAVLTALDRASREMSLKILEDEQTREGIARILLEEIEKKGVVKELADRDPNQLHEDMSSTVMDALKLMMEEIRKTREEVIEKMEEDHTIIGRNQKQLAEGIKAVIDVQTSSMETIANVVRQEGELTREKINEAKREINDKMSDHFYYANKLHP
jgi:phage terminase small subunit